MAFDAQQQPTRRKKDQAKKQGNEPLIVAFTLQTSRSDSASQSSYSTASL
jgi:hypothetical protein